MLGGESGGRRRIQGWNHIFLLRGSEGEEGPEGHLRRAVLAGGAKPQEATATKAGTAWHGHGGTIVKGEIKQSIKEWTGGGEKGVSVDSSFSGNKWKKWIVWGGYGAKRVPFHRYVLLVREALRPIRWRDEATGRETLTTYLKLQVECYAPGLGMSFLNFLSLVFPPGAPYSLQHEQAMAPLGLGTTSEHPDSFLGQWCCFQTWGDEHFKR